MENKCYASAASFGHCIIGNRAGAVKMIDKSKERGYWFLKLYINREKDCEPSD